MSDLNTEQFIWVQKPFVVEMEQIKHLSINARQEFAELSCDALKTEFNKRTLNSIRLVVKTEYPLLSDLAMVVLYHLQQLINANGIFSND